MSAEEARSRSLKVIRVALITPSTALRAGLLHMLAEDERLEVVLSESTLEGLPRALEAQAEVLILTPSAARGAELDKMLALARQLALLILVEDLRSELPKLPLEPGQSWGVLPLDVEPETLSAALRAVYEGLAVAPPDWFSRRRESRTAAENQDSGLVEGLTPREVEVLGALSLGLTNKQIALALGISEHTIKYHISSIYAKLDVMNRAEAVKVGVARGWIAV